MFVRSYVGKPRLSARSRFASLTPTFPTRSVQEAEGTPADEAPADEAPKAEQKKSTEVNEFGFPDNTAVAAMQPAQQTAYWKYQSRKHEDAERAYKAEIDGYKADAQAWRDAQEANKTDEQKAIEAAREAGRKEALEESNARSVLNLLQLGLTSRGKSAEDAEATAKLFDAKGFITESGEVDHERLSSTLDTIAGPVMGSNTRHRWPAMGQGAPGNGAPSSGVAAGREAYAAEKARRTGSKASA